MKTAKTYLSHILLAFLMVLALLLGCLSGCAKTESPVQQETTSASNSASQEKAEPFVSAQASEVSESAQEETPAVDEAQELPKQELDEETAALLDGKDHDFEQEIAYRYYHDGESKSELADNERNQWLAESKWDFDANGNGVFAVGIEASMSQSLYFLEYTSDYGENWSSAGVYSLVTWVEDVKVAGKRVVLSVANGVSESKHSLVYSDDLCQTLHERDTIDFAPHYLTAVIQDDASDLGMDLLGIDADGSLVLGWYHTTHINTSGFEYFDNAAQNKRNYFLIGKTDAALTRCEVLYATEKE